MEITSKAYRRPSIYLPLCLPLSLLIRGCCRTPNSKTALNATTHGLVNSFRPRGYMERQVNLETFRRGIENSGIKMDRDEIVELFKVIDTSGVCVCVLVCVCRLRMCMPLCVCMCVCGIGNLGIQMDRAEIVELSKTIDTSGTCLCMCM